jgi:flagellar protein FlaG
MVLSDNDNNKGHCEEDHIMDIGAISKISNTPVSFPDTSTSRDSQKQFGENPNISTEKMSTKQDLEKAVNGLNGWLKSGNSHLKFSFHEKLNEYYVQIVDDQTNEVIREIPPKKLLDIYADMQEKIGLLIDERR